MKPNKVKCRCLVCNVIFFTVPSRIAVGKGKYCSKICYNSIGKSQSTKEIWSQNRKGKSNTSATKFKKGQNCKELNINWKGGITNENLKLRQAPELIQWRKEVFERDNYICQICQQRGGKLVADHIKSWKNYPELRFDLSNGRTLCECCHRSTPNYGAKAWQGNN